MNNPTNEILEQLNNIGSAGKAAPAARTTASQAAVDLSSSDNKDQWRILLVDLIYNLNSSFRDVYYWEGVKTDKDPCREIVRILHKIKEIPNNEGTVRVSLRGTPGTKVSEKADYVIRVGQFTVDIAAISAVVKRMGIRLKHLEGRLIKSFEQFASQGIDTVFIKIPDESDEALDAMRISLRIISCYNQAVENDTAIKYVRNYENRQVQPMRNEFDQPDPNLTQVAALNNLSAESMRQMVQKVSALMKQPQFAQAGIQTVNVYQTIFHIKSLKEKLLRPPIELNSQMASMAEKGQTTANRGGGGSGQQGFAGSAGGPQSGSGRPATDPGGATGSDTEQAGDDPEYASFAAGNISAARADSALRKAEIAEFVKTSFGNSTGSATQAMKTIYGSDYKQLDQRGLEDRLNQIVDLLGVMESSGGSNQIVEDVREKVQTGLSQVPKDFLNDLVVQDDVIKIWDGEKEKIVGEADDNIVEIIETAKQRANARKKMRTFLGPDAQFTDEDIDQLAKTFEVSVNDAKEIVTLFKACFDRQDNFQRALFEKKVPEFSQFQKRIFEILWEFLRETPRRSDRLPFLNSLQLLVKEIQQPKQAIKVLLSDFLNDPAAVSFPDRNAMMLAIQFLRTYNKEINMDIEITPEEVLLVKVGMDERVRHYSAWKADGEQNKFVKKIITIRKKLLQSFELHGSDENVFPIRFMLALEREVHMFLALIGGGTAAAVIQGALKFYGNPASQIYLLEESRHYSPNLLQHLAVLIRGLGRVGQPADFDLLDSIKGRQRKFFDLSEEPRHTAQVRRTLGWIDSAKLEINGRTENN